MSNKHEVAVALSTIRRSLSWLSSDQSRREVLAQIGIESADALDKLTKCQGCNTPLDPVNAWMADGCPCNSPAGVNAGVLEDWRWFITQQNEQIKQAMATLAAAERDVSGFTKRAYANQNKIAELQAEVDRLREALKKNVDAIGVWMTSEVELKDKMKQEAADWAETDTQIRKAAATVLGDKVHGDSEFVPHAADVVDMLVAEVKRLRKIEDASAGVMLNLELARAEVRRLKTPNTLAAEQHHQIVQLKGEVERLLERIKLKNDALKVAVSYIALNDGGEE